MSGISLQSKLNSLIVRAGSGNPELLDVLQEIVNETRRLGIIIDPPPVANSRIAVTSVLAPQPPNNFRNTLRERNILLEWDAPGNEFVYYEIRKGTGRGTVLWVGVEWPFQTWVGNSDWESADKQFITSSLSAILEPHPVGETIYLIKSLSVQGVYSQGSRQTSIIVPPLGAVSITNNVIDNNVLLYWTVPATTFALKEYLVKREGVEYTRILGNFVAITEFISGTYNYSVTPIDIAGNVGPETVTTITVSQPPDFVLRNHFISDLTGGTFVNCFRELNYLLIPANITETFSQHFTTRGWNTIQQQIDAGYPLYIQPVPLTGSYKEVFDMGLIYPSTIVSITYTYEILTGSHTIGISTRTSSDGSSWSAPQLGQNIFATSVRYIEVTINVTAANDKSILKLFELQVFASVKEEMDSGQVNAVASDVGGTFVTFTKPYRDVTSITCTVEATAGAFSPLFDFNDIPNPTGFSVYVFDAAGVRASKLVHWKSRGII